MGLLGEDGCVFPICEGEFLRPDGRVECLEDEIEIEMIDENGCSIFRCEPV